MTPARRPHRPWLVPLVAVIVVAALFSAARPATFPHLHTLDLMLRQTAVVAIAASGMTLVVVMGGIDLSVGSAVALSTVLVAICLRSGFPPLIAIVVSIAALTLAGASSGALIAKLRAKPFLVTLGVMRILRGVAKGLAAEQTIAVDPHGLDALSMPGTSALVSPAVWLAIGIALVAAGVLKTLPLGRHIAAIGSNEAAARLAGIAVERVKILVYAAVGAAAALAGVVEFSTLTVGDPTDSVGLELDVIAAVVLGGGSLSGGAGSVAGSMLGALLMTVIKTGSTHVGLPNWVQEVLTGGIIVLAAALDWVRGRRQG